MNAPVTAEGREVWGLALRLGGQLRVAGGLSMRVTGWDMTAAFALGAALGIAPLAIAELLPAIEQAAMEKLNEALDQHHGA